MSRFEFFPNTLLYPVIESILKSGATLLLTLLVFSQSSFANNGAIAYAYPVEDIIVDGNLDDWPGDFTHYPMEFLGVGVPSVNGADLSANFRIGYDKRTNTIFIAVAVEDQSIRMDTSRYVNWNTHDGVELYLDPDHLETAAAITQYSNYAVIRRTFGHKDSWQGVDLKMKLTPTGRNYEWSIQLDQELTPGKSMAMDLSVIDKDEDDSFSWVSWGRYSQKLTNASRCGDLVIADDNMELVNLSGSLDLSHLISSPTEFPIRFNSLSYSDLHLQAISDSTGKYQITIPTGEYQVDIPEELQIINNDFYQIAPNQPLIFLASTSTTSAPVLSPTQIAGPDLTPNVGVLHDFDDKKINLIDQYIATYQKFYSIPGVSLALIKDGEVVYAQTYGVRSTRTNDPVTEETLFEAASITKPVFGFLVLRLAEQDIIDLDKPLYQYLPFEALEVTPEYKEMTARHVLIHQSGLPNWGVPLERAPGLEYGYSGEGFEYLKRVVCKITGKDIELLLDEQVIGPLDLYHMEFKDSEALEKCSCHWAPGE